MKKTLLLLIALAGVQTSAQPYDPYRPTFKSVKADGGTFSSLSFGSAQGGPVTATSVDAGVVLAGDGTAAAPAFELRGHGGNGLYWDTGASLATFTVGGTAKWIYGSGAIASFTNGGIQLGLTGQRWGNVWSTGTYASGAASGSNGFQCDNSLCRVGWPSAYVTANGTQLQLVSNGGQVILADRTGPSIQASAGTALTAFDLVGTLNTNTVAVGNLGASGPDDLQTYSIPASTLTTTGRCVRITATGTTANNANAKTVRLVYGAGPTVLIAKQLTASIAGTWQLTGAICRTGLSAQRNWGTGEQSGGTTISTTDGTGVWRVPTVTGTTTETETSAIVVKTQSTTTTTDNDVVSQILSVEYF